MEKVSVIIDMEQFSKWLVDVPHLVERALTNAIYKVTLLVERESKMNAPVDTGRLRSTISTDIRTLYAEVRTNVKYAIFVHDGTRYMRPRPFMADATKTVQGQVQNIVNEELKVLT